MSGISNVVIKIGAETASAVAAIGQVDKSLEKTTTSGQKMHAAITKAAIPAAAALTALTAVAITSAKAAADDQASRQALDSQIQRTTGSTKEAIAANEEWINSLSKSVAVSNEELRPAMAGAVRATGDLTKAHEMLKLGLDTSAATGKPLGAVMMALEKAYNGSTTSLKKLDPALSDAVLKTKDYAFIQAVLNKQVEGAAAGQAQTAAGQYKSMQIAMHELQVEIGTALLPVMEQLVGVASAVLGVFAGHTDVIVGVGVAVAGFAAAILVANAALSAYATVQEVAAVAQTIFNSSLVRTAALVLVNTVRLVIYGARQLIVAAATKAWAVAQWLLNAAMDANPIGLAIIAVAALTAGIVLAYKHSSTFRGIVQSAFGAARSAAASLVPILNAIVSAMRSLWQAAGPARSALVGAMHSIGAAIQAVLDAISSLISAISHIHFPSKPSWVPFAVPGVPAAAGAGTLAAGGGGPVINVTISGAIDPEATALAIRRVLTRYDRRRGQLPLGGGGRGA